MTPAASKATPYTGPTVILTAAEIKPLLSVLILHPRPWNDGLRARLRHALDLREPVEPAERTLPLGI